MFVDERWPPCRHGQRGQHNTVSESFFLFTGRWGLAPADAVVLSPARLTSIFDIRNPDRAVHIIASTIEVPRSVHYSPDNRFLVIGESSDMVSILDVAADYAIGQQIALFGAPPRPSLRSLGSPICPAGGPPDPPI